MYGLCSAKFKLSLLSVSRPLGANELARAPGSRGIRGGRGALWELTFYVTFSDRLATTSQRLFLSEC